LSISWKSYSEFVANVKCTAGALGVYGVHTQRVHCTHAKKIRQTGVWNEWPPAHVWCTTSASTASKW